MKAIEIIEQLNLIKHPEGGWFKEVYRSNEIITHTHLPQRFTGDRCFNTSIYFLLESNEFSAFHKIKSDELWHFYEGAVITIHFFDLDGSYKQISLGENLQYQCVVPANCWFAAEVISKDAYALVGCTVSPGFDFSDFEMAKRDELVAEYPMYSEIILKLTI